MTPFPLISIITPTYNRGTALQRAIARVRAQTIGDFEHIIVDDCSQDGTERIVRNISDKRIRYERFARWQGANAARNLGVELARAELLTFLDSDDEFLPTRLETTIDRYCAQPQVDLFISSFQTRKGSRICPSVNPDGCLTGDELERALMTYSINIAGTSITVRRDRLLRAGGFDPTIRRLQDREALLRLSQLGGAYLSSEIDWIKHRSQDSISRPRRGYVQALGAMMASHQELASQYRALLCYHVARHMLSDLTHGHPLHLMESYRENQAAPELRFAVGQLLWGYRAGSVKRRQVAAEIRQRQLAVNEIARHTLPFSPLSSDAQTGGLLTADRPLGVRAVA